jgi:hypothetical protein
VAVTFSSDGQSTGSWGNADRICPFVWLAVRRRNSLTSADHSASNRLKAQVRASLRQAKVELERRLAAWGIRLEGFEFRGVRRALAPRRHAGKSLHPRPDGEVKAGARRACGEGLFGRVDCHAVGRWPCRP